MELPTATTVPDTVQEDRPCLVCGYNIRHQKVAGRCPECGAPIMRSLQGLLLRYSAPEYVATLQRGIFIVQVSIVLGIILGVGMVGVMIAATGLKKSSGGLQGEILMQLVAAVSRLVTLTGWWLFSTPDPALTTSDPAHKTRRLLRIILAVSAVSSLAGFVMYLVPSLRAPLVGATTGSFNIPALTMAGLAGFVGVVTQLIGFIATMNYMRHLARRLPDMKLERQAAQYRWLLPVLYVFACGVGPIIVGVMYFLQINEWRKRLKYLAGAVMQDDIVAPA